MSTINTSYFYADLSIAQISQAEISAAVTEFIDSKERELLIRLLGYELFKAYTAGILVSTQKYKDIRDGKEYTDSLGRLSKWNGLAFTVGTSKKSPIANYVYWHYIRDNYTFTTGSSEKKTDIAINASPDAKLVRAWNEMVRWNFELLDFLTVNVADYPEYESVVLDTELYTRQNSLNL